MYTVLFDFNGTLFFDGKFHVEAWSQVCRMYHKDIKDLPMNVLGSRNDLIIQAIAPNLSPAERQALSQRKEALYRDICKQNPDKVQLVAGARELLSYLKDNHIPYGLASASIRANVDFYFEAFQIGQWFDQDDCVYDDGSYKDKGEMHLEAAKRLGTELSQCLIVEDSIQAISLAKKNKAARIIGVGEKSAHPAQRQAGADYCIQDFTEFKREWLYETSEDR